MSDYTPVLETPDLGPGHAREVLVRGEPVLVLNLGQTYFALEARCPESGGPLGLEAGRTDRLVCPDEGAVYAVETGERLDGAGRPLHRYDVRIEENTIGVGPVLSG